MYQSLYRKYRPNNFDEVVGQDVIIKILKNSIKNNCLNHAYLFTGPRGTGKTSIAKILAKTINCDNPINLIPCNNCVSCTQIKNRQTIDIIEIDAASNNGVDEIREIRNKVNLVPSIGKYKVYIIDEVHMLTTGAFNALLKTLEEPPSHIIFILATTEPHKIPMTILSRCQRFDFKKINKNAMIEKLKYVLKEENITYENNILPEIVRLSDGCMRDALSILEQIIAYSNNEVTLDDIHEINGTITQEELKNFINNIIEENYEDLFEMINIFDNNGKNFIKLTEEIILFLRNIMLKNNVPNYFNNTVVNIFDYEDLSNKFTKEIIIKYLNSFNDCINKMKNSNNSKIIFEMNIIELINKNELENEYKLLKTEKIKKDDNNFNNEKLENEIDIEIFSKIKNIRINNTLCNFNKKQFLDLLRRIDEVKSLIISPKYNECASLLLDGKLKAVGNENLLFIFENENASKYFNSKIVEIDEMMTDYFKISYKSIAIDNNEWKKIKEEFNSKKVEYKYIEEPKIKKINKKSDNIENLFENIVEYN